jgi:hypothetical protein
MEQFPANKWVSTAGPFMGAPCLSGGLLLHTRYLPPPRGAAPSFSRDHHRGAHLRISNFESRRRPGPTFPCRPAQSILPTSAPPKPPPTSPTDTWATPTNSYSQPHTSVVHRPPYPQQPAHARLATRATQRAEPKRRPKRPLG